MGVALFGFILALLLVVSGIPANALPDEGYLEFKEESAAPDLPQSADVARAEELLERASSADTGQQALDQDPDQIVSQEVAQPRQAENPQAARDGLPVAEKPKANQPTLSSSPRSKPSTSSAALSEREPNDSRSTANALPLEDTVSGSAKSASWSDADYFYIDLPQAGRTTLDFKFPKNLGTGDAYGLTVYDKNGYKLYTFNLDGGDWNGSYIRSQATFLPTGRSYIQIYGSKYDASWGAQYTLKVTNVFAKAPAPSIGGTAKVDKTLTARVGTWSPTPTKFTYQWKRGGKAIKGATAKTYKLKTVDAGKKITVTIKATKTGYTTSTRTSKARTIRG